MTNSSCFCNSKYCQICTRDGSINPLLEAPPRQNWELIEDAAKTIMQRAEGLLGDDGPDPVACHALAQQIIEEYATEVDCDVWASLDFEKPEE